MICRTLALAGAILYFAQPYAESPELDAFAREVRRIPVESRYLVRDMEKTFERTWAFLHWEHLKPLIRAFEAANR